MSNRIKRAYRRKALEHHPDRNYGNVETATSQFAEIQSAYEILADPQERAWYDSHRDAILRDDESAPNGEYEHNVRLTSAEDIVRILRKVGGSMPSSNASTGFFSILRDTFDALAHEEELSCHWEDLAAAPLPSFGDRHDDYDTIVKPFYTTWSSFATQKTFSWKDLYKYSDAPDRRTRRLMEKENRRFREEAIREFNDAVRSLVAFVKKRDPRIKLNSESEADRQRVIRDAAAAQAARSRAANHLKTAQLDALPDWAKSSEPAKSGESDDEVCPPAPKAEIIECVTCNKAFKSEKQYDSHERSKKHIRNVGQIRKEMRHDDVHFHLTREGSNPHSSIPYQDSHQSDGTDAFRFRPDSLADEPSMADDLDEGFVRGVDSIHLDDAADGLSQSLESLPATTKRYSLDDHDGSCNDSRTSQSSSHLPDEHSANRGLSTEKGTGDRLGSPKIGKAKRKRAKKRGQMSNEAGAAATVACNTCGTNFSSKTKLFHHLHITGHAQSSSDSRQAGKARKRP